MIRSLLLALALLGQPPLLVAQLPLPAAPLAETANPVEPAPDPEAERIRVESRIAQAQGELTETRYALEVAEVPRGSDDAGGPEAREALLKARIRMSRSRSRSSPSWAVPSCWASASVSRTSSTNSSAGSSCWGTGPSGPATGSRSKGPWA